MYLTAQELRVLQELAEADPRLHRLRKKLGAEDNRRRKQIERTKARQRMSRAYDEISQLRKEHPGWTVSIVEDEAQDIGYLMLQAPEEEDADPLLSQHVLPLDLARKLYDRVMLHEVATDEATA